MPKHGACCEQSDIVLGCPNALPASEGEALGAFVIVLREGFEAGLVIGLVLAFLKRTGHASHNSAVWMGVGAAVLSSIAMGALLFVTVGQLDGQAEMLYEGSAMLLACGVVTWMAFWMRRQAATIGGELRSQVSGAMAGGTVALASVSFVAVGREGLETALFLFASVGESGVVSTAIGGAAGLVVAISLGVLLYRGTLTLDLKRFFRVTGLLVIVFAAYLLFGGVQELGEAGGGEAVELLGLLGALLYAAFFGWRYLRPPGLARRQRESAPDPV